MDHNADVCPSGSPVPGGSDHPDSATNSVSTPLTAHLRRHLDLTKYYAGQLQRNACKTSKRAMSDLDALIFIGRPCTCRLLTNSSAKCCRSRGRPDNSRMQVQALSFRAFAPQSELMSSSEENAERCKSTTHIKYIKSSWLNPIYLLGSKH